MNNIVIPARPSIHWRVTIDLWFFIHNTAQLNNQLGIISYEDFLSIAFSRNATNTNLDVHCIPIEYAYPILGTNTRTALNTLLNTTYQITNPSNFLTYTYTNASSKWNHLRCAFSFATATHFINDTMASILATPQMYNTQTNFGSFMKKFYRMDDNVDLTIQNFNSFPTSFYLRNLNIFREYMPYSTIGLKYFNIHTITSMEDFPQLLFSVPFDNVSFDTKNFTVYDFSTLDGSLINTNTYNLTASTNNFKPKRNFYRLNLLPFNTDYTDTELKTTAAIPCSAPRSHCSSSQVPFNCIADNYLDITALTCANNCPSGYMRLPTAYLYKRREYCVMQCSVGANCASSNAFYKDITVFNCDTGAVTFSYNCYPQNSSQAGGSLQFSRLFNTHNIEIDLNAFYTRFAIDVWVFRDSLAEPNLTAGEELMILLTNSVAVSYDVNNSNFNVYSDFGAGTVRLTVNETWQHGRWLRFLLFNAELPTTNTTDMHFSTVDDLARDGNNFVNYPGSETLSHIYFCNDDTEITACAGVTWANAYYKNLRIWSANYLSIDSLVNSHVL